MKSKEAWTVIKSHLPYNYRHKLPEDKGLLVQAAQEVERILSHAEKHAAVINELNEKINRQKAALRKFYKMYYGVNGEGPDPDMDVEDHDLLAGEVGMCDNSSDTVENGALSREYSLEKRVKELEEESSISNRALGDMAQVISARDDNRIHWTAIMDSFVGKAQVLHMKDKENAGKPVSNLQGLNIYQSWTGNKKEDSKEPGYLLINVPVAAGTDHNEAKRIANSYKQFIKDQLNDPTVTVVVVPSFNDKESTLQTVR